MKSVSGVFLLLVMMTLPFALFGICILYKSDAAEAI